MDVMQTPDIATTDVASLPDPLPENLVVLDVREPGEWVTGHVAGATHVPLNDLPERVGDLDPQAPTLVVCHVGGRSAMATRWLQARGHDVTNLDGGMDAWQAAGRPVVTGD
jgi:rhodanese-related sulfurtransferase